MHTKLYFNICLPFIYGVVIRNYLNAFNLNCISILSIMSFAMIKINHTTPTRNYFMNKIDLTYSVKIDDTVSHFFSYIFYKLNKFNIS